MRGTHLLRLHCFATSLQRFKCPIHTRKMASTSAAAPPAPPRLRYADVGINLTDPVFRGLYHGKRAHPDDLDGVIRRARAAGCRTFMVTGSDLPNSERAVELAKQYRTCFATVGMHPCSARSLDAHPGGAPALLGALRTLATTSGSSPSVAAFGEIGLDYDRLGLCDAPTQRRAFEAQLDLAVELQLPLFLHSRAAAADFEALLKPRLAKLPKRGLVHSFTGTAEEMRAVLDMGLDVGVNGCSLKTEENLDVVREVPLDRLQIETDGPWCEMRPSHASAAHRKEAPPLPKAVKKEKWDADAMVKGRNEPCTIAHVAHVVASVKGIPVEEVCEA